MTDPTPFPELNDLLADLVEDVEAILGDNLVGAYVVGSFALGAGDMSSDCDFLVVTADRLSGAEERALRQLHAEIPTRAGYWAINLEGSYAPKADLESVDAIGREWLYIDRGRSQMEWSTHCNVADTRWVLRERGIALRGPQPSTFVCAIRPDALRDAVRPAIDSFMADLSTWADFEIIWTQRYVMESLCRMLHTLEKGEVISKRAGLEWALEELAPQWHDLISQAIADRPAAWNDPVRAGSVEATKAFAQYVREYAAGR